MYENVIVTPIALWANLNFYLFFITFVYVSGGEWYSCQG